MTTKCTGLMGRILGHKWKPFIYHFDAREFNNITGRFETVKDWGFKSKCLRCGAVTGEKK